MRVVYVAGPYRAATPRGIVENIRVAEAAALQVWQMGAAALCPHLNTALFDGAASDGVWLRGGLELLRRCDAVLMVGDWKDSVGSLKEKHEAEVCNMPVFLTISALAEWLLKEVK